MHVDAGQVDRLSSNENGKYATVSFSSLALRRKPEYLKSKNNVVILLETSASYIRLNSLGVLYLRSISNSSTITLPCAYLVFKNLCGNFFTELIFAQLPSSSLCFSKREFETDHE